MRFLLIAVFSVCVLLTNGQNKTVTAASDIQSVIVFSSGARIERVANVPVLPGRTEISFKGLSNQLDPQSVQLSGNANITLLSVQAAKDFISERKLNEEEKRFLDSITIIRDQTDLAKKMLEVYKNEENMLIKNEAIGGQSGVKTSDLKEALDLHRQRLTELYKKQLELNKKADQFDNQLKKYQEQLQVFSKKKDSVNYIVTALIESKTSANIKFQLSYNVRDAGWYPTYDVRVKDVKEPLDFLMNANVFQRSGETWKDVAIRLSTGSPNENATPPELQPWRLGFYDPSLVMRSPMQSLLVTGRVTDENGEPVLAATVQLKGTGNATITDANGFFKLGDVSQLTAAQVSAVGYESKEVQLIAGYNTVILKKSDQRLQEVVVTALGTELRGKVAGVETNKLIVRGVKSMELVDVSTQFDPTTIIYTIDEKYSIETDGKTTTIGVKNFEVPAIYQYFSAPRMDPSSFLTAQIVNWQDYELQPGEASLYFEGSYLGKTYLDLSSVSDTLPLSLGKDNGVRITRQLVKEYSSKRFIGTNQSDSRQYQVAIRNNKKEPVQIRIQDQFPISVTRDINVTDMKAPEGRIDDKTGIVSWDIHLAPGEEKKLWMGFTVKYPRDRRVVLE